MSGRLCTDEHVPRVFVATLRANGYDVVTARDAVGTGTPDADLLEYCRANDRILITNDKKDFGQYGSSEQTHAGIIIYTSPSRLRNRPETAVRVLERMFELWSPEELRDHVVWLDEWWSLID